MIPRYANFHRTAGWWRVVPDLYGSTHVFNKVLDERQSETGAPFCVRIKGIKHMRKFVFRDACPVIYYLYNRHVVGLDGVTTPEGES